MNIIQVMEPFLQKSQKAQERLKGAYDRTEKRCHDLVSLYCEDPAKLGIDDFFKEVLEFLQRFDRAQVRIYYTMLYYTYYLILLQCYCSMQCTPTSHQNIIMQRCIECTTSSVCSEQTRQHLFACITYSVLTSLPGILN
jgi:hypothetical protein